MPFGPLAEVDSRRTLRLAPGSEGSRPRPGPVVYWLHRDMRAADNWGLLLAQRLALDADRPLAVVFALTAHYPGATWRHYAFLVRGLEGTARRLAALGIPFFLLSGHPPSEVLGFLARHQAAAVVTDFDPLRWKQAWCHQVARTAHIPLWEVDSRNVVPCRLVSDKREYMARTLRPKLHRLLPEFLTPIPALRPHAVAWPGSPSEPDWATALARCGADRQVGEVADISPGEEAAATALETFVTHGLPGYAQGRNDPNRDQVSGLSPYLHFGQLSAQRVALTVASSPAPEEDREAFLEQLLVRRELADNFCLHTPAYDGMEGFSEWSRRTLEEHRGDPRPALYSLEDLTAGRTHDPLWNAAQAQMVATGRMHGWLRMYWAKQIPLWSAGPEEALARGIALNDRFLLDGRDSNGYTGLAWAMGGVHDRPWSPRPVMGTIRAMTLAGARRKFDVAGFVRRWGGQTTSG